MAAPKACQDELSPKSLIVKKNALAHRRAAPQGMIWPYFLPLEVHRGGAEGLFDDGLKAFQCCFCRFSDVLVFVRYREQEFRPDFFAIVSL